MSTGALQRVVRRAGEQRTAAAERCDLCSVPVSSEHRHLLDTAREEVLCACRPCSLLFVREAASERRYLLIPCRRRRVAPVATESLGVPVGLAFFVPRSDGSVLAHYPSPAGPARWEVEASVWSSVTGDRPDLDGLEPDVEALLVNTTLGREEHWVVPLDDCYRMVAVVRREWRGLSGGSRVWPEIDRFFAELAES